MVVLYLFHEANTCSKSAMDILEITNDDPNENIQRATSGGVL